MIFNEVGEGQLNSILVRRLSMKVPTAAPSVAPELFPNLTLENDRPEWGFLKGEYRWARASVGAAAVGNLTWCALRNPAGSGIIAVVKQVTQSSTARATLYLGYQSPTTLVNSASGIALDSRQPSNSQCFVLDGNNVGVPAGFSTLAIVVANVAFDEPVVVAPGAWLLCLNTSTNLAMPYSFCWTERQAVTGELG